MIDDALLDRLGDAYQKVRERYWIPYNNYLKSGDTAKMRYSAEKPTRWRRSDGLEFDNPNLHWEHPTFEQFVQATLRNRGIWVE